MVGFACTCHTFKGLSNLWKWSLLGIIARVQRLELLFAALKQILEWGHTGKFQLTLSRKARSGVAVVRNDDAH